MSAFGRKNGPGAMRPAFGVAKPMHVLTPQSGGSSQGAEADGHGSQFPPIDPSALPPLDGGEASPQQAKNAEAMARNEPEQGEERGVVINISSGAAYEGQIGQCAYSATKAGVIGLNMPAARELGARGIRVNAIAPGLFLTPMAAQVAPEVLASLKAMTEAPNRLGDPAEFAHCCAFIIENAYLNGETIRLDAASRLRSR